jgi:hypothetical protein
MPSTNLSPKLPLTTKRCSRGIVDTILLPKGIVTVARVPANAGGMRWWAVVGGHDALVEYQREFFLVTKSVVASSHHLVGELTASIETLLCCLT